MIAPWTHASELEPDMPVGAIQSAIVVVVVVVVVVVDVVLTVVVEASTALQTPHATGQFEMTSSCPACV